MSKKRKRHALPNGHRFICGCGLHDKGSCPHEARAPRATAPKPSQTVSAPLMGTETSLAETYAAHAALGIIGASE
jgi:hypothetical protein